MIEDGTPMLGQEHILSVTDRFKNGDKSDPVYEEVVNILNDRFNLTPKDVFMKTGGDGHIRIYKKGNQHDQS